MVFVGFKVGSMAKRYGEGGIVAERGCDFVRKILTTSTVVGAYMIMRPEGAEQSRVGATQ
jgi:hypothetical protein